MPESDPLNVQAARSPFPYLEILKDTKGYIPESDPLNVPAARSPFPGVTL